MWIHRSINNQIFTLSVPNFCLAPILREWVFLVWLVGMLWHGLTNGTDCVHLESWCWICWSGRRCWILYPSNRFEQLCRAEFSSIFPVSWDTCCRQSKSQKRINGQGLLCQVWCLNLQNHFSSVDQWLCCCTEGNGECHC